MCCTRQGGDRDNQERLESLEKSSVSGGDRNHEGDVLLRAERRKMMGWRERGGDMWGTTTTIRHLLHMSDGRRGICQTTLPSSLCKRQTDCACVPAPGWFLWHKTASPSQKTPRAAKGDSAGHPLESKTQNVNLVREFQGSKSRALCSIMIRLTTVN